MSYVECQFKLEPFYPFNEILIAQLSEIGFESFVEAAEEEQLCAYVLESDFSEEAVLAICNALTGLTYNLNSKVIEKENWNKKWEENFPSVQVETFCYIRAPFHPVKENVDYEIVIEPKMSFGTGHHQTTQLMIQLMKDIDFKNKCVLDMGSGTGILAILAKKMGADQVDAIDIEDWAFENMKENFDRNEVSVKAFLGGAEVLEKNVFAYDVLIANINKNILLRDMNVYQSVLKPGGILLLSGFFYTDVEDMLKHKDLKYMKLRSTVQKEDWCALKLEKL